VSEMQMTNDADFQALIDSYKDKVRRSGVLNDDYDFQISPGIDLSLEDVLKASQILSKRSWRYTHPHVLSSLEELKRLSESSRSARPTNSGSELEGFFARIQEQFRSIHASLQKEFLAPFEVAIEDIDYLQVCLFGRTGSGKSTTVEALIDGSGEEISDGRQNYSKEIRSEVYRDILKLIDTPGIASFIKSPNLVKQAEMAANRSDLVILMLPNDISDPELDTYRKLQEKGKPILLLHNMKARFDADNAYQLKLPPAVLARSLQQVETSMSKDQDFGDIKNRAIDYLGFDPDVVPVIPVHSLLAFLSNKQLDIKLNEKLYQYSNFDELNRQIAEEIQSHGRMFRVKQPLDLLIHNFNLLVNGLTEILRALEAAEIALKKTIDDFPKLGTELNNLESALREDILSLYFKAKVNAVPDIVDRLFDERGEEEQRRILARFLPEAEIRRRLDDYQQELEQKLKEEIENYFKDFETNLSVGLKGLSFPDLNIEMPDDFGEILAGIGAGMGILAGLAGAVAAAPILGPIGAIGGLALGPIGWIALGTVGIIGGLLGLFRGDRSEEKRTAHEKLREEINTIESKVRDAVTQSIRTTLVTIERDHVQPARNLLDNDIRLQKQSTKTLLQNFRTVQTEVSKYKYQQLIQQLPDLTFYLPLLGTEVSAQVRDKLEQSKVQEQFGLSQRSKRLVSENGCQNLLQVASIPAKEWLNCEGFSYRSLSTLQRFFQRDFVETATFYLPLIDRQVSATNRNKLQRTQAEEQFSLSKRIQQAISELECETLLEIASISAEKWLACKGVGQESLTNLRQFLCDNFVEDESSDNAGPLEGIQVKNVQVTANAINITIESGGDLDLGKMSRILSRVEQKTVRVQCATSRNSSNRWPHLSV